MGEMSWKPIVTDELEQLSSPRSEMRRGLLIAGAFFVGLLGVAAVIPLDAGAVAQGFVAVSGSRQVVQSKDGGIVTALNVTEGQKVNRGDILIQISEGQLAATERAMTGEFVTLLAQRARLEAELSRAGSISEPLEFQTLQPGDLALANDAMRGQRLLFDARRSSAETERGVLGQRIRQQSEQIEAFNYQISSNREQQRLIGDELNGLKELEARGFVSKNRIRAMERGAAELDGNFGALNADIARTHEGIGEAQLQIASVGRRMIEDSATQLRDVQLRLVELQPNLLATREQLARTMVRATATGRVVGLKAHTVGGIVNPAEVIMEIVPQNKELVVEAKASPNDADDLKLGMTTQVRFSALQERNLPTLFGKISKVSADSFEDERSGMRYFNVEVQVPARELAKIKKIRGENAIRAGLPADILVPLRKRSALSYLLEPLTHMFWLSGREQ
jgi:HlyD family type I secretion membrane fusion protein